MRQKALQLKNHLIDAFKDVWSRIFSLGHRIVAMKSDTWAVFIPGAFLRDYHEHGIRVSPTAPYLKEMHMQSTFRYFYGDGKGHVENK